MFPVWPKQVKGGRGAKNKTKQHVDAKKDKQNNY